MSDWKAGSPHPDFPHVVASEEEGKWEPAPGYKRVSPGSKDDLSVTWDRGQQSPDWSHMVAGNEEGSWIIRPGYVRANPESEDDFSVTWAPGSRHPWFPNVFAGDEEEKWVPPPESQAVEGPFFKVDTLALKPQKVLTIDEAGIVQADFIRKGQTELAERHRGWYEANGEAAEFKMGNSWYELYRPRYSTSLDGTALVSFQVHHINNTRRTPPDVVNVELYVDTVTGELLSTTVTHKEAGKIFKKEKAPSVPIAEIVGAALDLLEDHLKVLGERGGHLQLPTAAKHCVNAVLANIKWQ